MNCIVDTHILIWSFTDPEKLSAKHRNILVNNDHTIYYSQFSLWEISIKYTLGKIGLNKNTPEQFYKELASSYYICKQIENEELVSFYRLPIEHKDPFDRAIIWQAINSDLHLLSVDNKLDGYRKHGLKVL
jgi:PIN domain nuclease of toxin-antitoxin system